MGRNYWIKCSAKCLKITGFQMVSYILLRVSTLARTTHQITWPFSKADLAGTLRSAFAKLRPCLTEFFEINVHCHLMKHLCRYFLCDPHMLRLGCPRVWPVQGEMTGVIWCMEDILMTCGGRDNGPGNKNQLFSSSLETEKMISSSCLWCGMRPVFSWWWMWFR